MTDLVKYWVNGGANHGIIIIGDERKDQPHVRNLSKSAVLTVVYQCDTVPPVASMLGLKCGFAAEVHGRLEG